MVNFRECVCVFGLGCTMMVVLGVFHDACSRFHHDGLRLCASLPHVFELVSGDPVGPCCEVCGWIHHPFVWVHSR